MWIADRTDNKIYAYDMTTKARPPYQDFDTCKLRAIPTHTAYGQMVRPCGLLMMEVAVLIKSMLMT